MPWLTGFHNPTGLRPALLIPLFVGWQGGNRYLIQQIGPADNVTSFIDFDGELNCHLQLQKIELNVGDQSLWGVEFRSGDISFGSVTDIAPVLRKKLSQNEFSEHPWLGAEIAALCGDIARYNRYLRGLFKGLWEQAPIAAEVWRDNVVLLPIVRQELADMLPSPAARNAKLLQEVRTITRGSTLQIEAPTGPWDLPASLVGKLKRTRECAKLFGLENVELVLNRRTEARSPRKAVQEHAAPYAIAEAFSGTGSMVIGRAPSAHWPKYFLPIRARSSISQGQPLLAFAILNSTTEQVNAALQWLEKQTKAKVRVAIVMRPVGFGTPRRDNLDVFHLDRLHRACDSVFVIRNHTLQKPGGITPNLAAAQRGVAYARACINGLMVLALRYPDFRELQRFLPKNGYGLVGRISGKRDSGNVDDAVFGALTTMLHENLPLENARRLIVLGEERHLSEGGIDHSLHHLISQNRSVPIDIIKSPIKSTRLICMAVGIEPVPVDRVSFRKFCERLLRASGWKIGFRDRDESIIYCSREKESRAVGLLTRAELTPVNPIVDALLRFRELNRNSVAQILTDFTPSRALADVAVATNIRIFHYSKLDINTN